MMMMRMRRRIQKPDLQEKGASNKAAHFSANVNENMCIYINELDGNRFNLGYKYAAKNLHCGT